VDGRDKPDHDGWDRRSRMTAQHAKASPPPPSFATVPFSPRPRVRFRAALPPETRPRRPRRGPARSRARSLRPQGPLERRRRHGAIDLPDSQIGAVENNTGGIGETSILARPAKATAPSRSLRSPSSSTRSSEPAPMHHFSYRDGALFAEDVDLRRIADEVGTPVYVYSSATIERHYRLYAEAMTRAAGGGKAHVFYAMKANGNLGVLKTLAALGAGADTKDTISTSRPRRQAGPGEQDPRDQHHMQQQHARPHPEPQGQGLAGQGRVGSRSKDRHRGHPGEFPQMIMIFICWASGNCWPGRILRCRRGAVLAL